MQVSETNQYIIRQLIRYHKYIEQCPDWPHPYNYGIPCKRCESFYIGWIWWRDRLQKVEA